MYTEASFSAGYFVQLPLPWGRFFFYCKTLSSSEF